MITYISFITAKLTASFLKKSLKELLFRLKQYSTKILLYQRSNFKGWKIPIADLGCIDEFK